MAKTVYHYGVEISPRRMQILNFEESFVQEIYKYSNGPTRVHSSKDW